MQNNISTKEERRKAVPQKKHCNNEKYRKNLETAHLLYGGFKSMIIVIKYDKKGYAYEI